MKSNWTEYRYTINFDGICSNCNNRKSCIFIKDSKSYIREQMHSNRVVDVGISVYSCRNYEAETENICNDNACSDCKKE